MQPEEEKQGAAESQEQSNEISISTRQASVTSGMLRCPECESSLIRKPIGPALVLVSVAGFVSLLPLGVLLSALQLAYIQTVLLIALALSVLAILVTTCIALAGRHCCLNCGHRFRSMCKAKRPWMGSSFPWRFVILNAVLLSFICVSSREMLELIYNGVFSIIVMKTVLAGIGSAFLICVSLGYQVLVYEIFKKRIKRNLLWAILFLLPAVVLGTYQLYASLPTVNAQRILTLAELAPLPESATEIKCYTWSFIFSGEQFLRFRASPRDIEQFLDESPILRGAEFETFSAERMRVRSPNDPEKLGQLHEDGHETFVPDPSTPDWYKDEIRQGRHYIIRPEWGYYPGEVIVDDEEHFVFVKIIWS